MFRNPGSIPKTRIPPACFVVFRQVARNENICQEACAIYRRNRINGPNSATLRLTQTEKIASVAKLDVANIPQILNPPMKKGAKPRIFGLFSTFHHANSTYAQTAYGT